MHSSHTFSLAPVHAEYILLSSCGTYMIWSNGARTLHMAKKTHVTEQDLMGYNKRVDDKGRHAHIEQEMLNPIQNHVLL